MTRTIYICPMHKDILMDKPGKCPKCAMALSESRAKPRGESKGDGGHEGHEGHGGLVPSGVEGDHMSHHRMMAEDFKRRFFITLPLVIIVLLLSSKIQEWLGFSFEFPGRQIILFGLGSVIALWGGWPFFTAAKDELLSKNYGMMTLVTLAVLAGYSFSVAATFVFPGESLWWEISTLVLAFLFGHWIEMRAVVGTGGALQELAKLIPPTAHKVNGGRGLPAGRQGVGGRIVDVPTSELVKGDFVLVKPGERVPVDGIVVEGESSVNEAMITGESRPVFKKKGDDVIGGTINNDGSLTVCVTKVGSESALAQIMTLVQQAQETRPSVQRVADKAANVLTLTAIVVGSGTFVYWFLLNPQGAIFAATLAITVVVITCPHALGLAIPTVTTITTTLAAKNGILIKDMKALEVARKLDWVVFDKTGTLTKGEFGVQRIVILNEVKNLKRSFANAQDDILALAASVDYHSQHQVARAIVKEAERRGLKFSPAKNFKSYPGRGAEGMVSGKRVVIGNSTMMEELRIKYEVLSIKKKRAKSLVFVAVDKKLAGVIVLADVIREESKETVKRLHEMGIKVAMLTGDNESIARSVAKEIGIDTYFAEVLPNQKVEKVKELQHKGRTVAMVGDGVNDAPALTQAHIGFAIGAGTDVAQEAGQIVLVKNNPLDVVKAINLSRKVDLKMKQNLAWAAGYNLLAIPAAAGVFYGYGILLRPEWAALLMSASSIIVVLNALLLRRARL